MGKALRIGIITAYPQEDWHSRQLIDAVKRFGEAVVIRPEMLGARLTPSGVTVFAENTVLPVVDGFVLARGFGEKGNSDFLVPVYQIIQRAGHILVNGIDALLTAIDKFETSYRSAASRRAHASGGRGARGGDGAYGIARVGVSGSQTLIWFIRCWRGIAAGYPGRTGALTRIVGTIRGDLFTGIHSDTGQRYSSLCGR